MKENWNILGVCCFKTCHKPITILEHKSPVHKGVINGECI